MAKTSTMITKSWSVILAIMLCVAFVPIGAFASVSQVWADTVTDNASVIRATLYEDGLFVIQNDSDDADYSNGSSKVEVWTMDADNDGVPPWYSATLNILNDIKTVRVADGVVPTSTAYWFSCFDNCTSMNLSGLDTSRVTNMESMFSSSSLKSLDVSNFSTSSVTNMDGMFSFCSALESLNLSSFDTSNVVSMSDMFSQCQMLEALDLSSFDTSNVTDMVDMFNECNSLEALDLSSFSTSNVTNMYGMFSGCSGLTSLDLSIFDTSKVFSVSYMFSDCPALESLNLSNFNTSNVEHMDGIFEGCTNLKQITVGANGNFTSLFPTEDASGKTVAWQNEQGKEFASSAIPANTAATYTRVIPGTKISLSKASVSGLSAKTYTGNALKPSITVKIGNTTLKKDTDYTVSYKNNTNVGTATVTITGKGNYSGTKTATFIITAASISKAPVSGVAAKTYTGKAQTQKPTIKVNGKTLKSGTDYTLSCKNNTKSGKATVTIKGKGNYSGSISKTFNIKPAKVTSVKAKSKSKGKVAVSWSNSKGKSAGVTGYKIVVKSGSKTIKTQYVSGRSAKSKTVSVAKKYKGKKVKVYVYAYKTIGKTKVCSSASSKVSVKVKK